MTPQFKTELQKLIDDAAWNLCEYDHDRDKKSFKAGCNFLLPLVESLLNIRDNYADYRSGFPNTDLKNQSDKDLLNLLRGER